MNLFSEHDLLERLSTLAVDSEEIDIATAWATPGRAIDALLDSKARIRAIVGITGWSTHPHVLRRLSERTDTFLRIPGHPPLFHPKLIIFRSRGRARVLCGSANLTSRGYENNREVGFVIDDDGSAADWFDVCWKEIDEQSSFDRMERYVKDWRPNLWRTSANRSAPLQKSGDAVPGDLLGQIDDWGSYAAAIESADEYWRSRYYWSVTGEFASWLSTIEQGRAILSQQSIARLDYLGYRIVMGIELKNEQSAYGLLGSMRGAGDAKEIFRSQEPSHKRARVHIHGMLMDAVAAEPAAFPQAAGRYVEQVTSIAGVSGGVATRLLALARPDLAVSINGGSSERLAAYSGIKALRRQGGAALPGVYQSFLEFLGEQGWYRSPRPQGTRQVAIAQSRAALLDSLAYEI